MARQVVLVTSASSGFGALAARELARRGHTAHAGMRAIDTRDATASTTSSTSQRTMPS